MTRDEILKFEGLELRKAVAKAKGYTVEWRGIECDVPREYRQLSAWVLCRDGKETDGQNSWPDRSEDDVWKDAPPFESDIGLALQLLIESGAEWTLGTVFAKPFRYVAEVYGKGFDYQGVVGHTPAEAVCRVYLLMKEDRYEQN